MSKTNLQLNAGDIASELHTVFGSEEPKNYVKDLFFENENIKGHVFENEINKKYWVDLQNNDVIVNTALFAHGKLATNKTKSFRGNFIAKDVTRLIEFIKKKHPEKIIHLILPRVETGVFEDHIVIEYRKITGLQTETLVIDSKPFPSGSKHKDENRIHMKRQAFTNATDCGFHVSQTFPVLRDLIKNNMEITFKNLNEQLDEQEKIKPIAVAKLEKLQKIYSSRVDKKEEYHTTLCFFKGGYKASDKKAAVEVILKNIKENKSDIFNGLTPIQKKAAHNSVLGKVVKEYLSQVATKDSNQLKK